MDLETQIVEFFARELLARHWALCAVCGLLVVIWRLWLRTIYLTEALRREQELALTRANETQTRLLQAFLSEPNPTLESLAGDERLEFKLTP